MKNVTKQRAHIARVRRLQHNLAAASAAEAASRLQMLEVNQARLAAMRGELRAGQGIGDGAALARIGELAMRLDGARLGLGRSIDQARALAAARESARLTARRDQESADKLHQAATSAAAASADRRLQARGARPRRATQMEDGEQ